MSGPLCLKCNTILSPFLIDRGDEYHVNCAPQGKSSFDEPPDPPGLTNGTEYARQLRRDVTDIILWADRNSARNQQTELGASEIGVECWRRLGYRIANVPEVNVDRDPWPAIVGTSIHSWLETAVNKYQDAHPINRWRTEMVVRPADNVLGHTDAYDEKNFAVVDWKTVGTEKIREIRKDAEKVPESYIEQINLYGLGHVKAGRRVDNVALVFLPRAGWLSGMYVWTAPFDRSRAEAALERVNKIGAGLIYYKVTEVPENWAKVPATPTKDCSWCPWFNPELATASDAGCPGKQK